MIVKTYTCRVEGCHEPAKYLGYPCEQHRQEFRAQWKEEHTRKAGDHRPGWLIGDACYVTLNHTTYPATIVDMSDVSIADKHTYYLVKLEYYVTYKDWSGQARTKAVQWPRPIQSYKLRRRVS